MAIFANNTKKSQVLSFQILSVVTQGVRPSSPCLSPPPPPGGLAAVIYTDALQTLIMLIGALILMGYSKWGPRVTWVGDRPSLRKRHLLSSRGSANPAVKSIPQGHSITDDFLETWLF